MSYHTTSKEHNPFRCSLGMSLQGYSYLGFPILNPQRILVLLDYSYLGCPTLSSMSNGQQFISMDFIIHKKFQYQMHIQSSRLNSFFMAFTKTYVYQSQSTAWPIKTKNIQHHSLSIMEEMSTKPSLPLKYSSFLFGNALVSLSATYSFVGRQ